MAWPPLAPVISVTFCFPIQASSKIVSKKSNVLLTGVSAAHLVSHLHLLTVPALLPLLPAAMGINFVDLGIAIGVLNIVSALVQTPLGFAVDRFGARKMLIGALALGSASFALIAILPTYPCLLVAMALAGIANGVYHPADYAILSTDMDRERMGRAFSIHTFSGFLGGALAPVIMVSVALAYGMQWAFTAAALIGMLALLVFSFGAYRFPSTREHPATLTSIAKPTGVSRPLSAATATIFILTLLFMMLSLSTGAVESFSVTVLTEEFGMALPLANMGLIAYLFASAFGVLAGGVLADRTERHGYVAAASFAMAAALIAIVAAAPLPEILLVCVLGMAGFFTGAVAPSRDMLVRAVAPSGAEGKVFGIVSTGANIGGVIGPILFGLLIDKQMASGVLWASVAFMLVTTLIFAIQERPFAAGQRARQRLCPIATK